MTPAKRGMRQGYTKCNKRKENDSTQPGHSKAKTNCPQFKLSTKSNNYNSSFPQGLRPLQRDLIKISFNFWSDISFLLKIWMLFSPNAPKQAKGSHSHTCVGHLSKSWTFHSNNKYWTKYENTCCSLKIANNMLHNCLIPSHWI